MIPITEDKRMLGYKQFAAYPNISCFVTTRVGGSSEGAYASFNCSPFCGDEAARVLSNQQRLCMGLPQAPLQLIIPQQIHETEVRVVDHAFLSHSAQVQHEKLTGVDAVITAEPGYCVCVSTADCVPLLLYDQKQKVVAAVHAGWRGTVHHIVSDTLEVMRKQFGASGSDIYAAIGPSISPGAFEVGIEVYDAFAQEGFDMSRISAWKAEKQKYHIDLWEANRLQLHAFGVPDAQIECANICTYTQHDIFFSARRLGIKSGRILSGIMIHR